MFSRRAHFDATENQLTTLLRARRAAGLAVHDLTQTNATTVDLALPFHAIHAALAHALPGPYAPEPFGLESARAAVIAHLQTLGAPAVDVAQVMLTASTSEAYGLLLTLLCDPGDAILVPQPSYPLFDYLARIHDVEIATWPSFFADGWHIDWHALAMAITPKTRAIVAVSPNNPTGAALTHGDLARLAALCAAHDLALIVDEVFADTLDPTRTELVRTVAGHNGCLTFALGGLSKTLLQPHLKLAWTVVAGPAGLQAEALARLEVLADTYLSVASPIQRALPTLLAEVPTVQRVLAQRLAENRRHLADALAGTAAQIVAADGGWSALVRLPVRADDVDWAVALLADAGVYVQPGWYFDLTGDGWIVISLLGEPRAFALGVGALATCVPRV